MDDTPDKQVNLDMGKGDSWAKDVRNGNQGVMLDDIPKLVAVLKLKLVDVSRVCVTPEQIAEYEAYKVIARTHLAQPPQLEQDWDKPA
jgi:hypothetical protein